MKDSKNSNTLGISFFGLLTVALVVLKLLELINISWFWIISLPILGPILSFLVIVIFLILFFGLLGMLTWIYDKIKALYYDLRKPSQT